MQGLRAAARFGNLFLLGDGRARRLRRARRVAGGRWLAIALLVLVNVEALRAPFTYQPFTGIPRVYALLRDEPGPVVVAEQPFFPRWAIFQNAPYVLASTAHWRPLMNGYSGYTPETLPAIRRRLLVFPAGLGDPGDEGRRRHARRRAPGGVPQGPPGRAAGRSTQRERLRAAGRSAGRDPACIG